MKQEVILIMNYGDEFQSKYITKVNGQLIDCNNYYNCFQ